MKFLPNIDSPADLKNLNIEDLPELVQEIRDYLIEIIPAIGGHFASSLGVVELTVVLHYLYNMPEDRFFWDVGHQGYVHKLLTGRREALKSIRQYGGISGFMKLDESPYDNFGAGHASTAISAALGAAKARDINHGSNKIVAIVGDGSMTGGLAYEGLNNAGASGTDITVVLNDNNMSISKNVGAISRYLVNMVSNPHYQKLRAKIWDLTGMMPKTETIRLMAKKFEESLKSLVIPGMLFEDLGFRYFGPIDGHNLNELTNVITNIRGLSGPQILHIITRKGKGFIAAEENPQKYHGIKAAKKPEVPVVSAPPAYLKVFGSSVVEFAEKDETIVAITAAMAEGTGLEEFGEKIPERFFDVGIAEGHAVTFAGGLSLDGIKPVVAIYSTFLQRAFDNVLHDICMQKLHVVFCLDRAGLVGEDGPTHHGCYDISYLGCMPAMVIAAPKDGRELRDLLYTGLYHNTGPFAIRYPKESVPDDDWNRPVRHLPIGKWEQLRDGRDVLILAAGSMVYPALSAAELLEKQGIQSAVVNARYVKPLDSDFLKDVIEEYDHVITIEENTLEGGFGDRVTRFFLENNWRTDLLFSFGIPDRFITHGPRKKLLEDIGLTPETIAERITAIVKDKRLTGQLF